MSDGLHRKLARSAHKRLLRANHAFSAARSSAFGLNRPPRTPELLVSLTSIPERLSRIHLVIDCLLRQTLKPERLILWLSECTQPGRPAVNPDSLPRSLSRLTRRGLTIQWCRDIGPYTKLIPALLAHPQALIVTADDDVYYPPNWLRELHEAYQRQPQFLHCHRAHRITFDAAGQLLPYNRWDELAPGFQGPSMYLLATGVGGVLYAPGQLHPDATRESLFLSLCPKNDDLWLKAMQVLSGVECRKVAPDSPPLYTIRIHRNRRLLDQNVNSGGNDVHLRKLAQHYPAFARFLNLC